jgi:hypothetical protein
MTPCSLVEVNLQEKWRQRIHPKRQKTSTRLHGVTLMKADILEIERGRGPPSRDPPVFSYVFIDNSRLQIHGKIKFVLPVQ